MLKCFAPSSTVVLCIICSVGIFWSVDPNVPSTARDLARVFKYLSTTVKTYPTGRGSVSGLGNSGAMTALNFLTDLYANYGQKKGISSSLNPEIVEAEFKRKSPEAYHADIFVEPGFECPYDADIKVIYTVYLLWLYLLNYFMGALLFPRVTMITLNPGEFDNLPGVHA